MIALMMTMLVLFIGLGSVVTVLPDGAECFDYWTREMERTSNSAPPMPSYTPTCHETAEDILWCDEYDHAEACFTTLFNSYETKWSSNGRLMIRQGNSGSFKFVAKGK